MTEHDNDVRRYFSLVAPGTALREGLERIVAGRTGALIVLGTSRHLASMSTGGFALDVDFTATALRELAKMDGAIILSNDRERIVAAGVHLAPEPTVTLETGTRHRTADRVARQTGIPVVTVSQSMSTIALYLDGVRHPVQRSDQLLAHANQALQTVERYRTRLREATNRLSALEVQDQVVVRDVISVAQRFEMLRRIASDVEGYVAELGTDGRLVELQLREAVDGLTELAELVRRDYESPELTFDLGSLRELPADDLLDVGLIARALGMGAATSLDDKLETRGYRQLAQIHRLPATVVQRLVEHFESLQALVGASTTELQKVDGVGEGRARVIRDGLLRLAEAAYDEQV